MDFREATQLLTSTDDDEILQFILQEVNTGILTASDARHLPFHDLCQRFELVLNRKDLNVIELALHGINNLLEIGPDLGGFVYVTCINRLLPLLSHANLKIVSVTQCVRFFLITNSIISL